LPLIAYCATRAETSFPEEENVVVLTEDNFDAFLASKPVSLVEFYAPWCGHCQSLAPVWAEAAERAKKLATPVPLAKVDATTSEDLATRYDINGYPTIKLVKDGVVEDYNGPRDADGIVAYVTKVSSFSLPQLKSSAELSALAKQGSTVILGLFRMPIAASAFFRTFKETAFEATGQGLMFAYSASYAAPPVLPLTADGRKPPVPSLVLVDPSRPEVAAATYTMPRKKDEFTLEAVSMWLNSVGVKVTIEAPVADEAPKNYHPEEDEHDHGEMYDD